MSRRSELEILSRQLAERRPSTAAAGWEYALRENAELVRALSSMRRYMHWLAHRMPTLQAERLLEVQELLPEWDQTIHRNLLRIERERWPAFIRPLVQRICKHVSSGDRPMTVVDLGAGAMETERQVLRHLIKTGHRRPVTFVGIDASADALRQARQNIATLGDQVHLVEAGLEQMIEQISRPSTGLRVIFCRASAGAIGLLAQQSVDVLFHCFFKHHLDRSAREQLDWTSAKAARIVLEYDGYQSMMHLLPVSVLTWNAPAFLAAYVFSHARFQTRRQLRARHPAGLHVYQNGCYLLERISKDEG